MARPLVFHADGVLVFLDYIRSVIPGVVAGTRVPDPRPATFLRVKRVGGDVDSLVTDRHRLDIHCWGPTEGDAWDLLREVRAYALVMAGKRSDTTVYRVRGVGGPQWLPDPESGQPRYAFAIEFSTRGAKE